MVDGCDKCQLALSEPVERKEYVPVLCDDCEREADRVCEREQAAQDRYRGYDTLEEWRGER